MESNIRARRYAQAVFEIALSKKELDNWQSDLSKIAVLGEDEAIVTALESSKIAFGDKAKLLAEWLAGINPLALNLVYLLVSKGRFSLVRDIAEEYQRLLDEYRGVSTAEVTTAVPLSDEDKLKLSKRLGELTGKTIILKSQVNPRLIGGIVARLDGKLLDGSTISKLAALKNELAGIR